MLFFLFFAAAAAHGGVQSYQVGSSWYKGFVAYTTPVGQVTAQRQWDSWDPITDPASSYMTCNKPGVVVTSQSIPIAAGSTIVSYWTKWEHTLGPMVTWLADCGGDCSTFSGKGAVWFKLNQAGLISGGLGSGVWGQGQMINQNSSWTTTIPKSLKPGNYLLRNEIIALHASNQPQFYMECAALTVSGAGTSTPGSSFKVSIPGVYSMSDPSININLYTNDNYAKTTYTIPGPAVWTG